MTTSITKKSFMYYMCILEKPTHSCIWNVYFGNKVIHSLTPTDAGDIT